MSHVSTTAHYNLPIYSGSDIINPLTDVNGTNEAVDTAIYEVAQELASGVTDITNVKNKVGDASLDTASQNLSGAVNELKSAIDTQAGDITDIEANVGTLQSQMATTTGNITTLNTTVAGLQTEVSGKASQTAVNTLATKVGTDALITTADNLSGAVNELKNEISHPIADITIHGDGVKTLGTVLTEIANAIDDTKITPNSKIIAYRDGNQYHSLLSPFQSGAYTWSVSQIRVSGTTTIIAIFVSEAWKTSTGRTSAAGYLEMNSSVASPTVTNDTSAVVASTDRFEIFY